ncbi:DUF982 domain-containing protein [Mesorhizobium amorphae]|uniref:DUF982 domain-containing protein n=1 Tax=Mesorhizobium amorphae TaxID=71433 RepID=UPI000B694AEE|nr:DUF982 domain-containing protein [Mesorhizobium amorphae]OWK21174.1 hypothetical protein AJ88_20640 [Mesorhizobium amorphae CCBAU 01583]
MSRFLPIDLTFVDGTTMVVSSITDAEKALAKQWRNKEAIDYVEAVRLLAGAKRGICKPEVAFDAFKLAALKQRLVQPRKSSAALSILDDLVS